MTPLACLILCLAPPPPAIQNAAVISGVAHRMSVVELRVGLEASYENPFDSNQVALDARIVGPSGQPTQVPGFYYRAFRRSVGKANLPVAYSSTEALKGGETATTRSYEKAELLTSTGKGEWRIRFTPLETGPHRVELTLRNRGTTVRAAGPKIVVQKPTADPGFVCVDPQNPRAFRSTNGKPYFPIGANVGWAGERGLADYEDWLPAYAKAGANWGRIWMSPSWTTFGLEQPGSGNEGKGFHRLDLANAWRLDQALDLAAKHGIRLDLCVDSYNVLRDGINWPEWERSVYNEANGGPLKRPADFWTDPKAAKAYRDKLRYIVARWGASPHVFAWELWNEVDGVRDYQAEPIRRWHREMAAYLRTLDPYRHLISTSFGGNGAGAGDRELFTLSEMDFAVAHIYEAADLPLAVASAQKRLGPLNKPFFVAEIGADTTGSRAEDDPDGLQLHDPLWASVASANSGGAMLWWWDSYIHPKNLYRLYDPVCRFLNGVDWGREHMRPVPASLEYATAPETPEYADLRLEGGPLQWSPSPENRPQTIAISEVGAKGGVVAGMLHGTGNHADLHNPVTFQVDAAHPTRFVVEVSDVSGYGGANLRIDLDGRPLLAKEFPDPDGDRRTETLKAFVGDYAIQIPAGRHTVKVENTGQDWVKADYRFEGFLKRTRPDLLCLASVGKTFGVVWLRQGNRSWRQVVAGKAPMKEIPPSRLALPNVPRGGWQVEFWETWQGKVLGTSTIVVGRDGWGRVSVPIVRGDLAVRLRRVSR